MLLGRPPLVLRDVTADLDGSARRVDARVDGRGVFVACDEPLLAPRAEALGSAFLLPAAARRRRLVLEDGVDPSWLDGLDAWARVVRAWWGYRAKTPRASLRPPSTDPVGAGTALAFSGGVDSFYALLDADPAPTHLVHVHGFDRRRDDTALLPRIRRMLDDVAAARGLVPVMLHTNLREHPLFGAVNWERTHGGALACVGHLLTPGIGRLLVAATFAGDDAPPWGSHAALDPWLGSRRLEIVHAGGDLRRSDKLRRIASEPLVQRHLRVCWESGGSTYNCSRCDKCLVTMLVLREAGALDAFAVFDPPADFPVALAGLERTVYRRTVRELAEATADRRLGTALRDLDGRSGAHPAYDRKVR